MRPIILSAVTSGSTSSWPSLALASSGCRHGRSIMSETTISLASDEDSGSRSIAPAWIPRACAGKMLFLAFLMFQIQPLIGKFILPLFGGAPAVWTTCMLFFQTVLFAGYAYAHASEHYLPPRMRTIVHLAL